MHDAHQPVGVAVRERPEQHVVNDAECRGGGTDAERQREDDGEAGPARSPCQPQPVARIPHDIRQPPRRSRVSRRLFDDVDAAGLDERGAAGLGGREPLCGFLLGERVDEAADLVVHLTLGAIAAERA